MSSRGILDADMKTVGRWLLLGWRWWCSELEAVVPERWRSGYSKRLPRLLFHHGRLVPEKTGDNAARWANPGPKRAIIIVPSELCLSRRLERPFVGRRELGSMVALEASALFPFPEGKIVVAARIIGESAVQGRAVVEVAALSADNASRIIKAIDDARIGVIRIIKQTEVPDGEAIDFTTALREAGLLPKVRSITPMLWLMVGVLAASNVAVSIWRDVSSVHRLERLIEEQQPAVTAARAITRRIGREASLVSESAALRKRHDAIGVLARVSQALPEGVWIQRYMWDGSTVRLAGYRPATADVGGALRQSRGFIEVRPLTDEIQPAVPSGIPFDLTAKVLPR